MKYLYNSGWQRFAFEKKKNKYKKQQQQQKQNKKKNQNFFDISCIAFFSVHFVSKKLDSL